MKKIIYFSFLIFSVITVKAQKDFSGIYLSGFQVTLIPSDEFKYEADETIEYTKIIKDDMLSLIVNDQTGQIPKSTITLYVDNIDRLVLAASTLIMYETWSVNSLTVDLKEFCSGELKINADYLFIEMASFSDFSLTGQVKEVCYGAQDDNLDISRLQAGKVIDCYNDRKEKRTGKIEISGYVKSKASSEPVAGVTLQLINPDGGGVDFARTDENGVYSFYDVFNKGIENINGIEQREYNLLVRKKGFKSPEKMTITLKKGEKLTPGTIYIEQ